MDRRDFPARPFRTPSNGRKLLRSPWLQGRLRLVNLLLAAWLLFLPASSSFAAAAPAAVAAPAATTAPAPAAAAPALATLLADPALQAVAAELEARGYALQPTVLERRTAGSHQVTVLPVEVQRPVDAPDPSDPQWTRSVPLFVMAYSRGGALDYVSQVRLDPEESLSLMELTFPQEPRVRVRAIDPTVPGQTRGPVYQVLAQLPDGSFDQVVEATGGALTFLNHPAVPVPDYLLGFWGCVKDCFLQINVGITWWQGGCMAGCLIGAGIATLASAGGAIVPALIACLKVCGLAAWIVRAAVLADCIILCL